MEILDVETEDRNGLVHVALKGELDLSTVAKVQDELRRVEADEPPVVVLDLSRHMTAIEAIDLPGHGRSGPAHRNDYSLDAHAGTVIRYLEQSARGPVHLVANSMGAAGSVQVAARRPGKGARRLAAASHDHARAALATAAPGGAAELEQITTFIATRSS